MGFAICPYWMKRAYIGPKKPALMNFSWALTLDKNSGNPGALDPSSKKIRDPVGPD
jgi:hypothetical protein